MIDVNMKSFDFLDVTLDLNTGFYKPFMKPNNIPIYVNKQSNHPPNILTNIPEGINKRLSTISAIENIFNSAVPLYQEALLKSGYSYKLHYLPPETPVTTHRKNRKRNILWFNPPFSKNVSTNIGRKFLEILDKCFPPSNPL